MSIPRTWTTREGIEVPIVSLADSHLLNCIRMLSKSYPLDWVKEALALAKSNALDYFEAQPDPDALGDGTFDDLVPQGQEHVKPVEMLAALLREAISRNLDTYGPNGSPGGPVRRPNPFSSVETPLASPRALPNDAQ